jgi:hypothetical protein
MADPGDSSASSTGICFPADFLDVVDALFCSPAAGGQAQCNKSAGAAKRVRRLLAKFHPNENLLGAHDQVEKVLERKSSL